MQGDKDANGVDTLNYMIDYSGNYYHVGLNNEQEMITDPIVLEENKLENTYDLKQLDWLEYLQHFCYLASSASNYREMLQKEQSDADLAVCDLLHYIELYEVGEGEYWKIIEQLKEARQRRRAAKDGMDIVEWFQNALGTSTNIAKAKAVIKQIEKLDRRRYVPRKFPELFIGATKCQSKVESAEGLQQEAMVQFEAEPEREKPMYTTRKETIFDTASIDWLEFAKQQVDFYQYAEQYACNLQLDLKEIELQIENILVEIEDANCNAMQGYMVFKELKELRNKRKEKERELQAVQILVEPFNCSAMAEAFQESVASIEKIRKGPEES